MELKEHYPRLRKQVPVLLKKYHKSSNSDQMDKKKGGSTAENPKVVPLSSGETALLGKTYSFNDGRAFPDLQKGGR